MSANYAAQKDDGLGQTEYERLAKVFVWADANGDESLSKSEMNLAFQKPGLKKFLDSLGLGDMTTFFADMLSFDKDNSGQLDFEEFIEYIEVTRGKEVEGKPAVITGAAKALLRDVFDAIDSGKYGGKGKTDRDMAGDGISAMEFKRAFKTSKKIQKTMIKLGFAEDKYGNQLFQSFKDAADADADGENLGIHDGAAGAGDENPNRMSFAEFCKFCNDLKTYQYGPAGTAGAGGGKKAKPKAKDSMREMYDAIDSGKFGYGDCANDGISKREFKKAFKTDKKIQKAMIKAGFGVSKYSQQLFTSFKEGASGDDDPKRMSFAEFKQFLDDLNAGKF